MDTIRPGCANALGTRNIREAQGVETGMEDGRVIRVLGISGSLRGVSSNSALVRAAARLALAEVEVSSR